MGAPAATPRPVRAAARGAVGAEGLLRGATPLRILLTNFRSPWDPSAGGGQIATHDLARSLLARGHEVGAIYAGTPSTAMACPYAVEWVAPSREPILTALSVARAARRLRRSWAPDLIHATSFEGACLPADLPRVATSHHPELPPWAPPAWSRPWARLRYFRWQQVAWLERRSLARADVVLFVSAFARGRAAERGYPTRRARVVPNGVDTLAFSPRPAGAPEASPTILFAGRMDEQKGVDVLLRAVSRLVPRPRLRLAGGGWKEAEYRRLAAELGLGETAEFLGQVPRAAMPALLHAASLVAVPSRYENLPLSVLEGMACGVPVVATRVGGVPEMLADGVEGILVPPEDPGALATALDRLLADRALAASMGAAGRRRVLAEHTWESVAARTEACYEELLR